MSNPGCLQVARVRDGVDHLAVHTHLNWGIMVVLHRQRYAVVARPQLTYNYFAVVVHLPQSLATENAMNRQTHLLAAECENGSLDCFLQQV